MDNKDSQILDSFIAEQAKPRRRTLLPWWIKTFAWVFMIFGSLSIPALILGLSGIQFQLAFYGMETYDPTSTMGMVLLAVFLLKGFTAYALWTEKDWAITLGQIDATVGIVLCIYSMLSPLLGELGEFNFTFRLELLLLIPYLIKLGSIKGQWLQLKEVQGPRQPTSRL